MQNHRYQTATHNQKCALLVHAAKQSSRVAFKGTGVVRGIAVRREAHRNGDTGIAWTERIKRCRSPLEAQLARIVPLQVQSQHFVFKSLLVQ